MHLLDTSTHDQKLLFPINFVQISTSDGNVQLAFASRAFRIDGYEDDIPHQSSTFYGKNKIK